MPTTLFTTYTPPKPPSVATLEVGDVIGEVLVTDSVLWVVIKKTDKTITVALAEDTGYSFIQSGHENVACPIVYHEVVAPTLPRQTRVLRDRKDGTIHLNSWSRAFRCTAIPFPDGRVGYVRRTDYSF